MPGGATNALGNVIGNWVIYASLKPASALATNSSSVSTYTVNGLQVGDCIDIYPQVNLATTTTYLTIGAAWVSAVNVLSIQWVNSTSATSGTITVGIPFVIQVTRPELSPFGYTNYPQAVE